MANVAARPAGDPRGTTLLETGVVPHALGIERDGASVWETARGTRPLPGSGSRTQPLGDTYGRGARTSVLPMERLPRIY